MRLYLEGTNLPYLLVYTIDIRYPALTLRWLVGKGSRGDTIRNEFFQMPHVR
jgi:hypothetical protein